jgi:hypothetical protein
LSLGTFARHMKINDQTRLLGQIVRLFSSIERF